MKIKKILYIMDPHCGWCYGNIPNINKIVNTYYDKIELEVIPGGMWIGSNAPVGGVEFENFIKAHSPSMEIRTGAIVGSNFFDLVKNANYTFSSLEPSAAIVAVKKMAPKKALEFTDLLQVSIFKDGKRLDSFSTYQSILEKLTIDSTEFKKNWLSDENKKITKNNFKIAQSLQTGFPTIALQDKNKNIEIISTGFIDSEIIIKKINELLLKNNF